jgi:thiol-disulfide isomerase/thioredoxin
MKNPLYCLLILSLMPLLQTARAQAPACRIEVTINGYDSKEVFLAYRRADKVYSKDTLSLADGKYVFEQDEQLPPGIYLILMPPDNKYFEFVVTRAEQHITVETAIPDFSKNLKIKGSKDNLLLREYQRYMGDMVGNSKKLQEELNAEADEKKKAELQEKLDDLGKEVRAHQNKIIKNNPGTYTAKLVSAFMEPEIPEAPKKADGTTDDNFRFRYFREHYWDGFDFSEEAFVNTPYLKEKMDRYLDKMTLQVPDSVKPAVDFLIQKSMANQEVYRYVLPYLLNKYYTPEIMGLDAVYVHIADNYYKAGKADWVTAENLKKISDDAYMIRGVLIGNQAPNIRVQRYDAASDAFSDQLISPYDVKADYTVVFLWKPGCGHCKKITDDLKPFYAEWKDKGVEVFSITSANSTEIKDAIKDIHEKNMPWIITADPYNRARALQNYYGVSLPKLYLLDKDKKIIANRVGVAQLPELIENHRRLRGSDE